MQGLRRNRAQAVQRDADLELRRARRGRAYSLDQGEKRACVQNELPLASRRGSAAEVGRLVERRQQSKADARGRRRIDQRLTHDARIVVRPAVGLVVQIVKFADRCVAGLQEICIQLRSDRVEQFGTHAAGELIHRFTPRPETVVVRRALFGESGHGALEGMAVYIRHTRNGGAVHEPRGRNDVVGRDVDDVAGRIYRNDDVATPTGRQPGGREAVAGLQGHGRWSLTCIVQGVTCRKRYSNTHYTLHLTRSDSPGRIARHE